MKNLQDIAMKTEKSVAEKEFIGLSCIDIKIKAKRGEPIEL